MVYIKFHSPLPRRKDILKLLHGVDSVILWLRGLLHGRDGGLLYILFWFLSYKVMHKIDLHFYIPVMQTVKMVKIPLTFKFS